MNYQLINLRHAVDALQYSSYKPLNTVGEIEGEYFLPDTFPSPEELYAKKEAYLKLPKESYYILQLIYNAPSELLEQFTACPGGKYKGLLVNYIRSHFNWKPAKIEKAISKLRSIL